MTEPVFPVATYRRIKLRLIHAHADSAIDDVITCIEEVLLLCPSGISATIFAHLPTKTFRMRRDDFRARDWKFYLTL
jgi:hypothetical protein